MNPNYTEISPHWGPVIYTMGNAISNLSGIFSTFVTGEMLGDHAESASDDWQKVIFLYDGQPNPKSKPNPNLNVNVTPNPNPNPNPNSNPHTNPTPNSKVFFLYAGQLAFFFAFFFAFMEGRPLQELN